MAIIMCFENCYCKQLCLRECVQSESMASFHGPIYCAFVVLGDSSYVYVWAT
jgi:hypothetical protein